MQTQEYWHNWFSQNGPWTAEKHNEFKRIVREEFNKWTDQQKNEFIDEFLYESRSRHAQNQSN